jgi:hypothetical protein
LDHRGWRAYTVPRGVPACNFFTVRALGSALFHRDYFSLAHVSSYPSVTDTRTLRTELLV